MSKIYHYASVSEALTLLKEKGFVYDYNIHENEIMENPKDFEIVHIYRYEGDSNPDDEAFVYGIKSKSGEKGVFVTGSSANSISEASKVLIDLSIKKHS
ncbi:hypothetical protein SY27_03035 [Flavobacterium sp. 316]|uniref:Phosphoribosylpyrophosphate synthetase n=1 Tax=Flavobacterium sediminilitoris TaxID=2024526 RepID=A0ABY4HL62_9FLAO|nr:MULTISPECIES: hypothetical protein [Flavobacterium]KIX22805.1 hypothetical protein SY27_03035 [Flavobacterium sp. 316]UOX33290.1 hypothetical protein LXD69_14750 [Flavobacterium sediminilitoris]